MAQSPAGSNVLDASDVIRQTPVSLDARMLVDWAAAVTESERVLLFDVY